MPDKTPHIIFAVTNDLTYDRRMDRICSTLASNGFQITLVGRKLNKSLPFHSDTYKGVRLRCWFTTGFPFYAEYNLRLFFWLLFRSCEVICACDLDTALPVRMIALLRKKKSVLDAHEYFTEVPEITSRPRIKVFWEWVGRITIPKFNLRYTVGEELARLMGETYKVPFHIIRNIAPYLPSQNMEEEILQREKILLYQGALNIGRGLEILLATMNRLPDWQLWLAGEGDISTILHDYTIQHHLEKQIHFLGWVKPQDLPALMDRARLGINLREKGSLNDYYSLPNKFFDCLHAGLPSINMKYPEYERIVERFECAILIDQLSIDQLVATINEIETNPEKLVVMSKACKLAATEFTWSREASKLVALYRELIPT